MVPGGRLRSDGAGHALRLVGRQGRSDAFYKLNSGAGTPPTSVSISSRSGTRTHPSGPTTPKASCAPVYDDLHDLCNTFCVDGQGATFPDQLASAFAEYVFRPAAAWPSPQDEFGKF